MRDAVLLNGDAVVFNVMFGPRVVTITGSAKLTASGFATVAGKKMCMEGDERRLSVSASYTAPGFPVPGMGNVVIHQLSLDQSTGALHAKTKALLQGITFIARFTPTQSAQTGGYAPPDPIVPSFGSGRFVASQSFVHG